MQPLNSLYLENSRSMHWSVLKAARVGDTRRAPVNDVQQQWQPNRNLLRTSARAPDAGGHTERTHQALQDLQVMMSSSRATVASLCVLGGHRVRTSRGRAPGHAESHATDGFTVQWGPALGAHPSGSLMMSSSRRPAASGASASTSVTSPAQAATKSCTPRAASACTRLHAHGQ